MAEPIKYLKSSAYESVRNACYKLLQIHTFRSSGENDSVQRASDMCHRSDERHKWKRQLSSKLATSHMIRSLVGLGCRYRIFANDNVIM